MNAMDPYFENRLKPVIQPANLRGGYGASGRLQFTPNEDALLAVGL